MAHTTKPVADSRSLLERLRQEIAKRRVPDGYQYEVLDHDTESEPIRETPIEFKYIDSVGRMITIVSEDPAKGPGHYLVERDDGTQWSVEAEMMESVSPYEAWCIERGIEPKEESEWRTPPK